MAVTKATIKAELLAAYNEAKSGGMSEDIFADKMADVFVNAILSADINLNVVFTQGIPVPNDGGAALQSAWKILGAQSGLIT